MVYTAIWRASSSYPYLYSYKVSMKSAKALPMYGSGHKSAGRTDGKTDGKTDGWTDNAITKSIRLWRGITSFALSGNEFRAAIIEGKKECWYKEVLVRAPSKWDELRNDLVDRSPTESGDSEDKYSGLRPLTILKKRMGLCLDLLVPRVSQPFR
ncbi:hypothetical protein DPMN_184689 [Dreissena polymorpha]|uniref:Uncharacterized protein n=1 Tax=Dreissena polymorpha TaxID=45954 RepID=A0A9D4DKU0_DREPO|nr:hypothetical protein DPMN_184689 [Dreissena polymorpha]